MTDTMIVLKAILQGEVVYKASDMTATTLNVLRELVDGSQITESRTGTIVSWHIPPNVLEYLDKKNWKAA